MSDESDSEDSESNRIEIQQQATFGATGELERSDEQSRPYSVVYSGMTVVKSSSRYKADTPRLDLGEEADTR